jgi:hypothetical protein
VGDAGHVRGRSPSERLTSACRPLSSQGILPVPSTASALLGKSVTIVASTLLVAAFALAARPFEQSQAWKGPVQAAVLVLAAAAACVVALASAEDMNLVDGAWASRVLEASAFVIIILLAATLVLLVVSVGRALLGGLRAEQAVIVAERVRAAASDPPSSAATIAVKRSLLVTRSLGPVELDDYTSQGAVNPLPFERPRALRSMGSFRSVHAQPQVSRGRLPIGSSRSALDDAGNARIPATDSVPQAHEV